LDSYILSQPITEESEAATNADKLEPIEMHITALLLLKLHYTACNVVLTAVLYE
jgi:hypothetical protein